VKREHNQYTKAYNTIYDVQVKVITYFVHVTPNFQKKFKTCQANAFHLISDRKILNNLIGCILWHTYFLFLSPRTFSFFQKDLNFISKSFPIQFKNLSFKSQFEFEYSNQFSKIPGLKNSQKVI
jgi:hypothetical protein